MTSPRKFLIELRAPPIDANYVHEVLVSHDVHAHIKQGIPCLLLGATGLRVSSFNNLCGRRSSKELVMSWSCVRHAVAR